MAGLDDTTARVVLTAFELGRRRGVAVECYPDLRHMLFTIIRDASAWCAASWASTEHLEALRALRVHLDSIIADVESEHAEDQKGYPCCAEFGTGSGEHGDECESGQTDDTEPL